MRDAHGRVKGKYEKGKHDKKALPGNDLTLSLDLELQEYAEKLMANKRGAIVAIEPGSGEILAYVSAPINMIEPTSMVNPITFDISSLA